MSTTNFSSDPGTAQSGPEESSDVKNRAEEAASTASDESKRVADVAKGEAKNVAAEAQHQLRGLMDQATSQVDEQSREQKGRLAETVRTFGDDLHTMTSNAEGGVAAQLVQQVSGQARDLASHLENREPSELLEDVRSFARRRPGTFLLGALAAGIVVGRVARGAKAAKDAQSAGASDTSLPGGTRPRTPAVGADDVSVTPVSGGARLEKDIGDKGVEISEAGIPSSSRGLA